MDKVEKLTKIMKIDKMAKMVSANKNPQKLKIVVLRIWAIIRT